MVRWLVIASVLGGCIDAGLVVCSNGLACPVGFACDVAHDTCTAPDQLVACAQLADLDPCMASNVPAGTCHEGVCLPNGCGNGRLDPPEVCDDGNTAGGDGCSSDCASNERCGNGIIDVVAEETCDDGGRRNHDGCTSGCRGEQPKWTHVVQTGHPLRVDAAGAYDEARGRFVLFGGLDAGFIAHDTTFEWDGADQTWLDATPRVRPSPRIGGRMVYDAARHVTVLFGGTDSSYTGLADTWEWDGVHWTDVTPVVSPPARYAHAMAYDARRKRVIVFGGANGGQLGDTWAWDGATWTELTAPGGPPGRRYAAMGYDPSRDQIVLYGGETLGAVGFRDTWVWDGDRWTNANGNDVGNKVAATATFDPSAGGIVLAGGNGFTYVWQGSAWVQYAGGIGFTQHVAYFDPTMSATIATGTAVARMFAIRPSSITPVAFEPMPTSRLGAQVAYDARRGRVVMFGGYDSMGMPLADTWELDGETWFQRATLGPPPRAHGAIAYDVARGRVVMFGGNAIDPNTWQWDGVTWSVAATSGPPPRNETSMVYDTASNTIVLFGGFDGATTYGDTWTFDGTTWTDRTITSPSGPAPRAYHAMAYDERHHAAVMFGGQVSTASDTLTNETWTWSAGVWTLQTPLGKPAARESHTMTYDPIRGEVVMFGGLNSGKLDDAWAWNGTAWSRVLTDVGPPPSVDAALVYDAVREQAILVDQDTWLLQWQADIADDACATAVDRDGDGLAGCADPDCWATCAPTCPSGVSCPASPACGDGIADPIETCRACPADAGACVARCGDTFCDASESAQSCPGDCTPL
jgi:cysteine-rich repeat protein